MTVRAGGFDPAHGWEDDLVGLVTEVRARLSGLGVLFRGKSAAAVRHPSAIGLGAGRSMRPFWIFFLVLRPGGPQLRDRLSPRLARLVRVVGGVDVAEVLGVRGELPLTEGLVPRPVVWSACARHVRRNRPVRHGVGVAVAAGLIGVTVDGHGSPPGSVGPCAGRRHWQWRPFTNGNGRRRRSVQRSGAGKR